MAAFRGVDPGVGTSLEGIVVGPEVFCHWTLGIPQPSNSEYKGVRIPRRWIAEDIKAGKRRKQKSPTPEVLR